MDGLDYDGRSNVLLTFNAATRKLNVSVDLITDNIYEREEDFNGVLTTSSPRVTISPGNALATIVDDESKRSN